MARTLLFRRVLLAAVTVAAVASRAAYAVTEPPPEPVHLGLYEWMGTAPSVIAADILVDDGKLVQASVRTSVKGELAPGAVLQIDLKGANRDRAVGVKPLDLQKGRGYLILLKSSDRRHDPAHPVYDIVRGIGGARELPLEGAAAVIDAATKLGQVQERKSDELLWASVPGFLDDPNPVLVDAALELVVKFRRESAALLPVLTPLLEAPRPDVRGRAALLVGRILGRDSAAMLPERGALVGELTGLARRDDDPAVRGTATAALATLPDAGIDEILKTISREDPDQNVRFQAERALFERRQSAELHRSN